MIVYNGINNLKCKTNLNLMWNLLKVNPIFLWKINLIVRSVYAEILVKAKRIIANLAKKEIGEGKPEIKEETGIRDLQIIAKNRKNKFKAKTYYQPQLRKNKYKLIRSQK